MADTKTHDDLSNLKVAELKKLLKAKGLPLTGTKSDLVERLRSVAEPEEEEVKDEQVKQEEGVQESTDPIEDKTSPVVTEASVKSIIEAPKKEPTSPTLITSPVSDNDKLKKRAERFGVVKEDDKKLVRAERFGIANEDTKKQQRAARFGITEITSPTQTSTTKTPTTPEDVEKLKERAKRFGQVLSPSLSKEDEDERIKKRKDRFGDVETVENNKPAKFAKITFDSPADDMKKKRAERFGLST